MLKLKHAILPRSTHAAWQFSHIISRCLPDLSARSGRTRPIFAQEYRKGAPIRSGRVEWAVGMRSVRKASGAGPTYMCCETNSCLESGAGPTYMCCETNSCLEKQCEPLLSKRSHAMIGASCEQWTHWDLNPGPSACEADVIPLHHVPSEVYCIWRALTTDSGNTSRLPRSPRPSTPPNPTTTTPSHPHTHPPPPLPAPVLRAKHASNINMARRRDGGESEKKTARERERERERERKRSKTQTPACTDASVATHQSL